MPFREWELALRESLNLSFMSCLENTLELSESSEHAISDREHLSLEIGVVPSPQVPELWPFEVFRRKASHHHDACKDVDRQG